MYINHVITKIDFSKKIREWDGFGFNYVQLSQSTDFWKDPQEYGGFSIISEEKRKEILELVFGENGLKPGVIKMFFDPFHQTEDHLNKPGAGNLDMSNYDHETSTQWVRYFAKEGLRISRENGRDLEIMICLYGMPGWMTVQKEVRGRDIDPKYVEELAKYMVSYAKFLREHDGLPVKYISVHNEGEDYARWPEDGSNTDIIGCIDYDAYWTPEFTRDFIKVLDKVLKANGLSDVKPTPGETSNWTNFFSWGFADAIADDEEAVNALGIITSHGFAGHVIGEPGFADHRSVGIDILREKRPELHSWVGSTSWSNMDARFVYELYGNIYVAKNNAIIPWAGIQRPAHWKGGDPNPGNAIQINEDGNYEIRDGYYYYKQVCPAGQPGMAVARTSSTNSQTCAIAFAQNGTKNPNSFVLVNTSSDGKRFDLTVEGNTGRRFAVYRTCDTEKNLQLKDLLVNEDHTCTYYAPKNSVTTFIEKQ